MTAITGPYVTGLKCTICGQLYKPGEVDYICPKHGDEGILDIVYNYEKAAEFFNPKMLAASKEQGMWRYRHLLPLPLDAKVPPLFTGQTPLYDAPRIAELCGLKKVVIKDDGRSPTASFKDRASALAVALAKAKNAATVATASTGNAAAALAGMSAAMGQPCVIFVPASAPEAKIAQLLAYGATVFAVQGSYDQAFELCLEACKNFGWYNRNTGYNPNMAEGKKTATFELCEQMGDNNGWQVPDALFVSVGDGCIIAGLHKGFKDLFALKMIPKIPRIYGIQAAGSDYMTQAFENKENVLTKPPINASTIADSISAGLPRDRIKAMAAVVETNGAFIRISDNEILAAIPELARLSGVFAEPAAAAAFAGLKAAMQKNILNKTETAALMITGSGLKDINSAVKAAQNIGSSPIALVPDNKAMLAIEKIYQKI